MKSKIQANAKLETKKGQDKTSRPFKITVLYSTGETMAL